MNTMLRQDGVSVPLEPEYLAVAGVDAPVPSAQTVAWVRFMPWAQAKATAAREGR